MRKACAYDHMQYFIHSDAGYQHSESAEKLGFEFQPRWTLKARFEAKIQRKVAWLRHQRECSAVLFCMLDL